MSRVQFTVSVDTDEELFGVDLYGRFEAVQDEIRAHVELAGFRLAGIRVDRVTAVGKVPPPPNVRL